MMKSTALTILALLILSAAAFAQDNGYRPPYGYGYGNGPSGYGSGSGYNGGYGYGYGCGYGGGWYGGGCRPGFITGYPGFGTIWGGYGGYYGYYAGGYYPGSWGGDGYFGHPNPSATVAGPGAPAQTAIDRSPQAISIREIEEGRRRFRMADYRGAVDSFRSAVVATTESPVAQAWFSVSLIAQGEGRNADKALRSAVAGGLTPGALSFEGLFRDEKERVRIVVALAKVGPEGSLAAAYALSLAGEPVRLKQLAEKDSAARLLLPKF